jgi:hypothetical protein
MTLDVALNKLGTRWKLGGQATPNGGTIAERQKAAKSGVYIAEGLPQ